MKFRNVTRSVAVGNPSDKPRRCSTLSLSVAAKKSNKPGSSSCSWRIPSRVTTSTLQVPREGKQTSICLTLHHAIVLFALEQKMSCLQSIKTLKGVIAARVICYPTLCPPEVDLCHPPGHVFIHCNFNYSILLMEEIPNNHLKCLKPCK